jgi:hypothetical protein
MIEILELHSLLSRTGERMQPAPWSHELQNYCMENHDSIIRFKQAPRVREVVSQGWGDPDFQLISGHDAIAKALSIQANSGSKGFWYVEVEVEVEVEGEGE